MEDDVLTLSPAEDSESSTAKYPPWSKVGESNSVFDNATLPKESPRRAVEPASPAKARNSKKVKREKIPLVRGLVSLDTALMTEREQTITGIKQAFLTLPPQDRRALALELAREHGHGIIQPEPAAPAPSPQDYGLDPKEADLALRYAAATKEADADSILHILTPKQIVAVVDGSTVGRLYKRFHELMREIVLPSGGFTSEDQAQTASKLLSADFHLREHLAKLEIPWPKQQTVLTGDAMRTAFRRAQEKLKAIAAGRPPPRIGRPTRRDQPHV